MAPHANSSHNGNRVIHEAIHFSLKLNVDEHNFNHANEFFSMCGFLQSRKDKIPINSIKDFNTSIMSQTVERVCKIVLFY